ncbi:MAG: ATP-binding cassette domain-containing protein [Bacteroidetes bacterium]|nr:ATP-binding cassette domain-containing protein [Bacteroidota bacterium]MCB0842081.1 ATP-binding cassette domain-containing protein [Bacteroidota bacterium]MCB0854330.1 ATP-binding cassette domain-containing protein [Bacteroidota bacterium]
MTTTKPLISFKDIHLALGNKIILADLNFEIQSGEFLYVVGHTGAGKSSILKMIYADCKPLKGNIAVEEFEVTNLKEKKIPFLRRKLGIIFQDFQLLPDRTVSDNIKFALRATGWKDRIKIKNRISEVLIQVGMAGKAHALPHQLSGGEQQRIAIARALINYPLVIIADEPTGNLDPEATKNIMEILKKVHLAGTTIIIATHEYNLLQKYPARVIEVVDGRIRDYPDSSGFLTRKNYSL